MRKQSSFTEAAKSIVKHPIFKKAAVALLLAVAEEFGGKKFGGRK